MTQAASDPAGPEATAYASLCQALERRPRRWLVTGAAGFIGSHVVERLLALGQEVRGLDDLSTGSLANLADVRAAVGEEAFARFRLIEGDVRDRSVARRAVEGIELVSHQAALGSVPRSLEEPLEVLDVNLQGGLVMFEAAREAGCERFVYASSSSVYGDDPRLPKREDRVGRPLSPYAASKRGLELLLGADYGTKHGTPAPRTIGLRYFNVVGPRQRADAAWAAVVPLWLTALRAGESPSVFGDGTGSRDFTPVGVVVQANLQAAAGPLPAGRGPTPSLVVNVALGQRTTLHALEQELRRALAEVGEPTTSPPARHLAPRAGDVAHSQADVSRFLEWFGGPPSEDLRGALVRTAAWSTFAR